MQICIDVVSRKVFVCGTITRISLSNAPYLNFFFSFKKVAVFWGEGTYYICTEQWGCIEIIMQQEEEGSEGDGVVTMVNIDCVILIDRYIHVFMQSPWFDNKNLRWIQFLHHPCNTTLPTYLYPLLLRILPISTSSLHHHHYIIITSFTNVEHHNNATTTRKAPSNFHFHHLSKYLSFYNAKYYLITILSKQVIDVCW